MSVSEVDSFLTQSGKPITITINDEQKAMLPSEAFVQLASEVRELKDELAVAHEIITELKYEQHENMQKQNEWINDIKEDMKFVTDNIGRLERERAKRNEQGLFKRLFGKN